MTELTRRRFLEVAALGAVAFAGCRPAPQGEPLAESRVLLAEDTLSAYDNWYASICRGCNAGCGILVRVVEGRAKKVEGNPEHPLNQGKLCARGQALVQEEYHPDRLTGPLSGGAPTSWDEGLDRLATRLRDRQGEVVFLTRPLRGHQALVVDRFTRALGATWLSLDLFGETPLKVAARQVFGQDRLPRFDLQNADYVLSFGADFLGGWLSPVNYSIQYGVFRQGSYRPGQLQPRPRGRLVQLEPRFSMTAAAADEWVPTRPGTEGLLALSIAQALVEQGHGDPSLAASLAPYAAAAENLDLGVARERVRGLAAEFGASQRPLAIGGGPVGAQTNGTAALAAILALNALVGSPSILGTAAPSPDLPAETLSSRLADWQALQDRLRARQVETVLVYDVNPAFLLPGFGAALVQAPFVVSFSSFRDETTALAQMTLPTHLPLEAWGSDVFDGSLALQQPVVRPFHDTRAFFDVLLALAQELGGDVEAALPWPTLKDVVRGGTPEPTWTALLQHGGSFAASAAQPLPSAPPSFQPVPPPRFSGSSNEDYALVLFPHHMLGDGRSAHLAWLQAAPDPLTSVTWQTWVELNPARARELGLAEGDLVRLESDQGSIEAPVYIHPAAPPDVLGVPIGQGHAQYGRWAERRGANPLQLLAPLVDEGSGALAYAATRVRLIKTGRHVGLPKMEGTVPAYQIPGQEVVKISHG